MRFDQYKRLTLEDIAKLNEGDVIREIIPSENHREDYIDYQIRTPVTVQIQECGNQFISFDARALRSSIHELPYNFISFYLSKNTPRPRLYRKVLN